MSEVEFFFTPLAAGGGGAIADRLDRGRVTEDGLPVGLQIVGRRLDDALVLRASAAFEAAAPWRDRWPPILAE